MQKITPINWVPIITMVLIILIVAISVFFKTNVMATGNFPTGPTIEDTGGVCIPNTETGCAVTNIPCCAPARCEMQIGRVIVQKGMCRIRFSTAN